MATKKGSTMADPKYKRRRPVPGEDLPALKNVMKEIQNQAISLEDFLTLISPHTGDKGAALAQVMAEDLQLFRKMVIKIYDTMTQDVTDVITNEQLELAKLYTERQELLIQKMVRMLQEIEDRVPGFDFEQYYKDPAAYLSTLFQLADIPDDEEINAARKHLAYHRLQWLQSEGERLKSENMKLQGRLNKLKKIQREEITATIQEELEAEKQKAQLEEQQKAMQNKLDQLGSELQTTIISEETSKADSKSGKQVAKKKKKPAKKVSIQEGPPKDDGGQTVATATVTETVTEKLESGQTQVSRSVRKLVSKKPRKTLEDAPPSQTGVEEVSSKTTVAAAKRRVVKKKKRVALKDRPEWKDVDIEEFATGQQQEVVETPIDIFGQTARRAPEDAGPATRAPSQGARPRQAEAPQPPGRRATAPRDTWARAGSSIHGGKRRSPDVGTRVETNRGSLWVVHGVAVLRVWLKSCPAPCRVPVPSVNLFH
ncbi:hypothetical protein CBL_08149 [Carabus blaptoides fortunei]